MPLSSPLPPSLPSPLSLLPPLPLPLPRYDECVANKEDLKQKCDLCTARLVRAEKVGPLGTTQECCKASGWVNWAEESTVKHQSVEKHDVHTWLFSHSSKHMQCSTTEVSNNNIRYFGIQEHNQTATLVLI